jgi:hypothetical protein
MLVDIDDYKIMFQTDLEDSCSLMKSVVVSHTGIKASLVVCPCNKIAELMFVVAGRPTSKNAYAFTKTSDLNIEG